MRYLAVTLMLCVASATLAQVFPEPQKYVVDAASVLQQSTEGQLNALLGELETRTTIEVAVVTVHTTAPLESKPYATALFNR
ncbi:MAG: TPM domain-containing protein, partial [Deinococcus sp.]|nr:TPM domain-containing protein [Deinococcus sp.]